MDLVTLITVALTLGLLYVASRLLEIWKFLRRAMKLPAEKALPIFGHSLAIMGPLNRLVGKLREINDANPPLYVLWFGLVPMLAVRKANHVETILGSSKYNEKAYQYKFIEPWLGTGLLTSKGFKWHSHRKMLTPTFHFAILENFVEVFSERSQILVKKLQKCVGSQSVDIFPYITMCALDIICETAMGVEVKAQEEGDHSEYVTAVKESSIDLLHRIITPWLYPDFLFNISPSGRRFNKHLKTLHGFTNKVISDRKELFKRKKETKVTDSNDIGRKKKLTFLDLLLEASESGNKLTDEELREEVDTFMFEGHDTTAAGITWALQMLGLHPNVQGKVYEELESIFQGSDRPPTIKDLSEMKYLERVIKESLRLCPSVPFIARYLKEDLEMDGLKVPAGMMIMFHIYFTHRDPEQFPEPEKFNPDNFLPERVAARHPYSYIPFSAGPRNCIGQKFAILEEKTVLSYVVRNYKLEATTEMANPLPDLILRPENGVRLKITPRFNK